MARTKFCQSFLVLILMFAAFSAGAQSFLPGQCIGNGGFCDAANRCVRDDPNADGVLIERTLGDCEIPLIITGPIDAEQPPITIPHVAYENRSRNGDFVVAAKDLNAGLPGGSKDLVVRVFPPDQMAKLTIVADPNSQASATFDGAGSVPVRATAARALPVQDGRSITVHDGQAITILGGNVSSRAHDIRIKATMDNQPVPGEFIFTVFRVNASAIIRGAIKDESVLPSTVLANSGMPNRVGIKRTMRAEFKDPLTLNKDGIITDLKPDGKPDRHGGEDFDVLNHKLINEVLTYGGIVLKGEIVPSGIPQYEFSRDLTPTPKPENRRSFNWRRQRTIREYYYVGNAFGGHLGDRCPDGDDDSTDDDEDLIPRKNTIWVFDTPFVPAVRIIGKNLKGIDRTDVGVGSTRRGIWQFQEWVDYGGVRVSSNVYWSWRWSYKNPGNGSTFVRDDTRGSRDNVLTVDNAPTPVPDCLEDLDPDQYAKGGARPGSQPPVVRPRPIVRPLPQPQPPTVNRPRPQP